ncbi:MAG: hypothetical protein M1818_002790 [Claussenomyces sp. TS43310]|nr:MAG: hypothetical protein M1818_002790 [Claussenomyces sp. TS43310]
MVSTTTPRSASGSASPSPDKLPSIAEGSHNKTQAQRRTSLGNILRRSKSGDLGARGGSKKQQAAAREQELLRRQREAAAIPQNPPSLPVLYNGAAPPQLQSFGGDDHTAAGSIASDQKSSNNYQGRLSVAASRTSVVNGTMPASPATTNGAHGSEAVDPYARTESMTHRGRYSYASSAVSTIGINSPRRVRRRKDPTPFNVLIIGAQNSGKTSFLNFLKSSLALPAKKRSQRPADPTDSLFAPQPTINGSFVPHFLETDIDGERVGLTLWDSEGLEKSVVDLQLRDMSAFVESKFEETFNEEMKVVRAPGVQDTHIHCAFLILDPSRLDRNLATAKARSANGNGTNSKYLPVARVIGGLDEDLDLQVLRMLQGKTTVVPVISKADTITTAHMSHLKKMVWDSLRKANIDPLEAFGLDDSDESPSNDRIDEGDEEEDDSDASDTPVSPTVLPIQNPDSPASSHSKRVSSSGSIRQHRRQMSKDNGLKASEEHPYLPLSIISPDIYEPELIGRKFPWGLADPLNVEHCDFMRLKETVFSEWRRELREASREIWYEGWRTSRLKPRESRGKR